MYWNNVDPVMVAGQRLVFDTLGYAVAQCEATGTRHGVWLDGVMRGLGPDDTALFVDIDAFPLTPTMVERAFAAAEVGRIFGVAQTANHLPDRDFVYAAPSFICLSRRVWDRIGQPSFVEDEASDVGMRVSRAAAAHDVTVELLYPNFVVVPRWRLGGKGCTGFGTFYGEGGVFHLFEARKTRRAGLRQIFDDVVACVAAGQEIDYVALHARVNSARYRLGAIRLYLARKAAKIRRQAMAPRGSGA